MHNFIKQYSQGLLTPAVHLFYITAFSMSDLLAHNLGQNNENV